MLNPPTPFAVAILLVAASCDHPDFEPLPEGVTLISPACETTYPLNTPLTFDWEVMEGADTYRVVVDGRIVADELTETSFTFEEGLSETPNDTSTWYVRAADEFQYEYSPVCRIRHFPPMITETPLSELCIDGSVLPEYTLRWSVSDDAVLQPTEFRFQLSSRLDFSALEIDEVTTDTERTLPADFQDTFYWRVAPIIDGQLGNFTLGDALTTANVCGDAVIEAELVSETDPLREGFPSLKAAAFSRVGFSDCSLGIYGIAWIDIACGEGTSTTESTIRFAAINSAGSVVLPPLDVFSYTIDQNPCENTGDIEFYSFLSQLAFDGDNFGLVFATGDDGIRFAQITPQGELVHTPVQLTTHRAIEPTLYFDGNHYLSAWEDWRNGIDVYFRKLDKGPTPTATFQEHPVTEFNDSTSTGRRDAPHIASDGQRTYVANCVGYQGVEVSQIDAAGNRISGPHLVEPQQSINEMKCFPRVVVPASENPSLLFHQMQRDQPSNSSIRLVSLLEDGSRDPSTPDPGYLLRFETGVGVADVMTHDGITQLVWRSGGLPLDGSVWSSTLSTTNVFSATLNGTTLEDTRLLYSLPSSFATVPPTRRFFPIQIAGTACSFATVMPELDTSSKTQRFTFVRWSR